MGRHEHLPTLTVVVRTNVEDTLKPNREWMLPKLMMWLPKHPGVHHLSQCVVERMCDLVHADQQVARHSTLREQARLQNQLRARFDKTLSASRRVEKEAAQALLAERMRLVFLLNTYGGLVSTSDKLIQLATKVRKNGGEVWAYGREKVNSAGAMIFMVADADRRVLVKRTPLFFHLSTSARRHSSHDHADSLIASVRRDEIAELRTIFATNCVHRDYARYLRRSVDSINATTPFGEDAKWTISDLEAEQFWHVRRQGLWNARGSYFANIGGASNAKELLRLPEARAVRNFFR